MPKTHIKLPASDGERLLRLLYVIGVEGAHTISVYTSRRGRTWVSIKTWGAEVYSSSAEVDNDRGEYGLLRAMVSACMTHLAKIDGRVTRGDTWMGLRMVDDAWADMEDHFDTWLTAFEPMRASPDLGTPTNTNGAMPSPTQTK